MGCYPSNNWIYYNSTTFISLNWHYRIHFLKTKLRASNVILKGAWQRKEKRVWKQLLITGYLPSQWQDGYLGCSQLRCRKTDASFQWNSKLSLLCLLEKQFRFLSSPTNQSSSAKPEIFPPRYFRDKTRGKTRDKKSPQGLIKKTQKFG